MTLLILLLVFSFTKRGIYSQSLGINLVVMGDLKVSIVIIRPNEELVSWVDLPSNLSVKVYKTGVFYPALSLWKLGLMDRDQYNYVTKSLTTTLGVALPKVVLVSKESSPESLLWALGNPMTQTNLGWRDRLLIRRELTNLVAAKKIITLDLPPNVLEKTLEPDGREVVSFNSVLPMWNKNKFLMEAILGEAVGARINNLSEIKGLGVTVSRQLEAAGLRVVEVASDGEKKPGIKSGCYYLFGNEKTFRLTEEFLKNHLGCRLWNGSPAKPIDPGEVYLWIY